MAIYEPRLITLAQEIEQAGADWEAKREEIARTLTARRVAVLISKDETLPELIRSGSALFAGRRVLSICNAWLDAETDKALYGKPDATLPPDPLDAPWRLPTIEPARAGEEWS